jgi:hypothetical protein
MSVLARATTTSHRRVLLALARAEGGRQEVSIPGGRVDVLTAGEAIEVKHGKQWRQALGQAISYGIQTDRQPRVHFFGDVSCVAIDVITRAGVRITFEMSDKAHE